jgi:glycosyltransferase involved in cell wall biosynthesis
MLSTLLAALQDQSTSDAFTYSAVVVDNDLDQSAAGVVAEWQAKSSVRIDYHWEPEQNIALARNKAVDNAGGNFIAFIDDDEFPERTWLLNLFDTLRSYLADAALGPVRPHDPVGTPEWLIKCRLCERPSHPTGTVLKGKQTRTGNVLFARRMFARPEDRFDSRFGRTGGEDIQFFRMMEAKGKKYVWCEEAPVYEAVPPERWSAVFYTRRSLRIGGNAGRTARRRNSLMQSLYAAIKSLGALVVMAPMLPVARFLGMHVYMRVLTKLVYNFSFTSSLLGMATAMEREE